jgi:hypothetical protein
MNQVNAIFKGMAAGANGRETLIACLYTGPAAPAAASPMPRAPEPPLGAPLDPSFGACIEDTFNTNGSLHDGAIMLGRDETAATYRVTGWSYRLFPPPYGSAAGVNRGSAFHSCLAMSAQADVDVIYLISGNRAYRFRRGAVTEL